MNRKMKIQSNLKAIANVETAADYSVEIHNLKAKKQALQRSKKLAVGDMEKKRIGKQIKDITDHIHKMEGKHQDMRPDQMMTDRT